jgi:DNA helicase-2/ATP-dependent DNA helicase PcrA
MEISKFDLKYTTLRKEIIQQRFSHLNPMQQKAVFQTEGPLLVLAGAGSGKTTVLIQRIIYLLQFGNGYHNTQAPDDATPEDLLYLAQYLTSPSEEKKEKAERLCAVRPAKPWEIIAITFTNKAAKELKERLVQGIGQEDADCIWAQTFHSACMRILRRDIDKLGYDSNFTIYDEDDKKKVMTEIVRSLSLDEKMFDVKIISNQISHAKDNLKTSSDMIKEAGNDFFKGKVAQIYQCYDKKLKDANALDFDDIIVKTVQLLKQEPDVLHYYQNKFRYVMVDEYQDTNHAQYVLTSLLAGGYQNICVVGDDDQSIYKFRGANVTNILEFEKNYPKAITIRLEQNYRSTQNILSVANELIRNNYNRKGKELWTDNGTGSKIKLHRSDSQEGEADYIARTILNGVEKGRHWSDFAILYRNHVLSNNIERAFKANSIPYRIVSGLRFFDRAEVKDMLAYLWIIENPSDTLRLLRIINNPARKIGAKALETAQQLAAEKQLPLFEIVSHASHYPELSRTAKAMESFSSMIQSLQEMKNFLPIDELYDELLNRSGYLESLKNKKNQESQNRIENIMELKSNLAEFMNRSEEATLAAFLEEMALFTNFDQLDADADAVVMMTVHSAKGLEFPEVFLCGMEEGIFPGFRAAEKEEDMEEERRLCYVAITRAKEQLYLTCTSRRMMYGQTRYAKPSKFIAELPEEYLDSNLTSTALDPVSEPSFDFPQTTSSTYHTSFSGKKTASDHILSLQVGDQVKHKVFGVGTIVSVKPMGGDQLLEISFDDKGTKKLLAKSAMQFMKKI